VQLATSICNAKKEISFRQVCRSGSGIFLRILARIFQDRSLFWIHIPSLAKDGVDFLKVKKRISILFSSNFDIACRFVSIRFDCLCTSKSFFSLKVGSGHSELSAVWLTYVRFLMVHTQTCFLFLCSDSSTVQNVVPITIVHVVKIKGLRRNCSDYRSLSELKVGLLGVGEMGQALARVFAGQLIKNVGFFNISYTIIP
jgi:hypothetical protein